MMRDRQGEYDFAVSPGYEAPTLALNSVPPTAVAYGLLAGNIGSGSPWYVPLTFAHAEP